MLLILDGTVTEPAIDVGIAAVDEDVLPIVTLPFDAVYVQVIPSTVSVNANEHVATTDDSNTTTNFFIHQFPLPLRQNRAGVPPSPVISTEAVQSPIRKHGCKETRPADWSAMRAPRRTCRSDLKFGRFSRTIKSAWLRVLCPAWRW